MMSFNRGVFMNLNDMRVFAIYPGRFHPWHLGHKGVYDWLVSKFGVDSVYITATGVTDPLRSPFSFEDRKKMMMLTGVPSVGIKQVTNNYNLSAISSDIPIDVEKDAVFFAISQNDMSEEPRFKSFTKKDGSPAYLQPLPKDTSKIEPAVKHGYLVVVPTTKFSVLGTEMSSASELRFLYGSLDPISKEKFITDLFGSMNKEVKDVLDAKLNSKVKDAIREFVRQVLREGDDENIANAIKKKNAAAADEERFKVKKAESAMKDHIKNMKKIESEGGDVSSHKGKLSTMQKDLVVAKKKLAAANVIRSA